tara:strand:- start:1095 stop:1340 length:246 start_codon:yes stop_codon:yes gene_type:complete
MTNFTKLKHQVKSSRYYLFWGAATIAVVIGQIYIGNGYRRMAETGDTISADINLLIEVLTMPVEQKFYFEPDNPYEMPIIQ